MVREGYVNCARWHGKYP